MKKVLLLCLTALMCCVTGAWAVTGSGTESDPYVVASGETYTVPAQATVFISFTAPENGTLNLGQSGWSMMGWMVKGPNNSDYGQYVGMQENWGATKSTDFPSMVAGQTYLIKNNGTVYSDEIITVTFTSSADDPNAFSIVSAEPADGSTLDGLAVGETINITLDKPVAYLRARIDGSINGYVSEVEATPVGEGTPVLDESGNPVIFEDRTDPSNTFELMAYTEWTVGPEQIGESNGWTFYEGDTYTVTFLSYADKNAWYDMTPSYQATITYKGSAAAEQYSDIRVINVTPDPNNTNDLENMLSEDNHIVTVTFDGIVDSDVQAHINQGYGMTMDVNSIEVNTVDGQSVVTIDVPVSSTDYEIMLAVRATENGMDLNDEDPVYEGSFSSGWYTFAMPCAGGRKADMTLGYESLTPADGAYVQSLSELTFTMNNGTDSDGWYGATSKANAYVLNADNEKVADILLSLDGSNVTAQICELGSVDYEAETGTPAEITEPGVYRVQIDSLSIGDGNFDVNYPWLDGNTGVGKCNPTWTWTINVVDEIVTVNDVDPAPYSVTGVYDDEIPAEVRITMSSANFSVTSATLRYGMNTMENAEYTVESDSVLVVSLSDAARAERHVALMITAAADNGAPIVYGVENPEEEGQMILLTFQTDRAVFVPGNITPAEGEVESLSTITIEFNENVGNLDYDKTITMSGFGGTCAIDYDPFEWNRVVINLSEEITEEGTYTLTIPEATIYSEDISFGFVDDNNQPMGDLYNPALVYVYTINGIGTSITGIKTDANGNVKVYTIDGVYVGEGAAAETINSLPAGVYIINGTKVAIK